MGNPMNGGLDLAAIAAQQKAEREAKAAQEAIEREAEEHGFETVMPIVMHVQPVINNLGQQGFALTTMPAASCETCHSLVLQQRWKNHSTTHAQMPVGRQPIATTMEGVDIYDVEGPR